jgi:hypothetical protein
MEGDVLERLLGAIERERTKMERLECEERGGSMGNGSD